MNKEDKNIIGMEYIPTDNSWCINLKTYKKAYITSGYHTNEENDATFAIVSIPYEEVIPTAMGPKAYTFVNVKSNKTKNIYRVLYSTSNVIKNMDKEIKITPPEGYEIDKENSTFECIKFKKKEQKPWRYDERQIITGYYISNISSTVTSSSWCGCALYNRESNYNLYATEKQAKSALAMARISQIMANDKRFGGVVTDTEWDNNYLLKYIISRECNRICITDYYSYYEFLAFHTKNQRDLFLEENEDLVKDYLMID